MDNFIHIDFETRSECDLMKCGSRVYAEHPTTEILCLVVKRGTHTSIVKRENFEVGVIGHWIESAANCEDEIFVAHNAMFEFNIWNAIMVKRYGFNPIPISRWRCTMASAMYKALPASLGQCAAVLTLDKQKDEEGRRVMLKMSRPRKATKNDSSKWHESEEDFKILYAYCIDDVLTEEAIHEKIGLLPDGEQKVWELDMEINDKGVFFDYELAESAIELCKQEETFLIEKFRKITNVNSPKSRVKYREWLATQGIEVPSTAKDVLKTKVDSGTPEAKEAILLAFEINKSSVSKYNAILKGRADDDRVHGLFQYHGATTGRWAGRMVQLQNLPRGYDCPEEQDDAIEVIKFANRKLASMFDDPMTLSSNCIRGCLTAPKGKGLIVYDYSQIEARVLPWIAGDQDTLDIFASGRDVYKDAASGIYKVSYEEVTKDQRFVGKVATLALGYQGWIGAFNALASMAKRTFTDDEAEEIAGAWRNAHPEIRSFWGQVEKAALKCIRRKMPIEVGCVKFFCNDTFMKILLPSGRCLSYYKPWVGRNENKAGKQSVYFMGFNIQRQWGKVATYGGKITENIVQAISRDLLVYSMFNLKKKGFDIIGHVHDEVIIEVDSKKYLKEVHELMCEKPDWAKGLPMGADGFSGKRYRK